MQIENVYSQTIINNYPTNKIVRLICSVLFLIAFTLPFSTSATSILFMIFLLLWLIEGDFNNKTAYVWQYKACFASLIIFISLLLGSLYATSNLTDILLYLKKMTKLIYLPFLIPYFNNQNQRKWVINGLIMAGMLTTTIGIIDNSNASPFKNTIDTSLITVIITFLLMHKLDLKNKLYFNCAVIFSILINIFYLFYISLGRTSQLIFLFLIPLFLAQKINLTKKLVITLSILLITIIMTITIAFCGLFSSRLKTNWSDVTRQYDNYRSHPSSYEQTSISQRLSYYKITLHLIKEKPFLGWGTGTFGSVYKDYVHKHSLLPKDQQKFLYTKNPHNEYLLFAAQLGIYGFGLLLWFFYVLVKASFLIPFTYEKYVLQGTVMILAIGCLANSWLLDFIGHLFIMLIAMCLGALPYANAKHQ